MNLKRYLAFSIIGLAFLVSLPVAYAIASDTTEAEYISEISITNDGADATNVFTTFNLTTQDLIDNNYISANCLNTAMLSNTGADIAYMPAPGATDNWCVYVPAINENATLDYSLYMGGSTDMDGKIRYFPDDAGMTANDTATLELGDNFTIEQKGWWDTSTIGNSGIDKPDAFAINVTASGNITAAILEAVSDNSTPTGTNDPDTEWTDEAQAIDGNTGTAAQEDSVTGNDWTAYIEIEVPTYTNIAEVGIWADSTRNSLATVDIDTYDGSGWSDQFEGSISENEWDSFTVNALGVTKYRLRFKDTDGASYRLDLYETNYREPVSVTATGVSSGEHTVTANYTPNLLTNSSFESGDPPDDWTAEGIGVSFAQDSTTVYSGNYSGNLTNANGEVGYIRQSPSSPSQYTETTMTLAAQVWADTASRVRPVLFDHTGAGWASTTGTYHTGSSGWEWLTVTRTMRAGIDNLQARPISIDSGSSITAFVDTAILIVGDNISDYNTFRLFVDAVEQDQIYTEVSVPDNTSDWYYYQNMATYWDYTKIWLGDTLTQHIEWENDEYEFTDLSANDHDTTPTFRTGPSDNDVQGLVESFTPTTQQKARSWNVSDPQSPITGNPEEPTDYYTELTNTDNIIMGSFWNDILDDGDVPRSLFWIPAAFLLAVIFGMAVYFFSGSIIAQVIVMAFILAGFATTALPFWVVIVFVIDCTAIAMASKQFGWG